LILSNINTKGRCIPADIPDTFKSCCKEHQSQKSAAAIAIELKGNWGIMTESSG